MKVKIKGQDDKLNSLVIEKWRYVYLTRDSKLPDVVEKQKRADKRYAEKYSGESSPFTPSRPMSNLKVVFSKKMQEKLPQEIREMLPKWPTKLVVSNVLFNIKDGVMFINFFSDIKVQ